MNQLEKQMNDVNIKILKYNKYAVYGNKNANV